MTDKANQIIEWSKSVTDQTKNEYDPIARQILAINLVVALYNCWRETRFSHVRGVGVTIQTKIDRVVKKIDPEFSALIQRAITEEPKPQKFIANVGVAKIYKNTIFATKNSVIGKLRRIAGLAAGMQDKNTVYRNYTEKLIAIWHDAIEFPEDIIFKTDSGFSFNLIPADFEAIEQYIDGFDLDRSQIGSEPDKNKLLTA
jgi:hypothetical protein